MFQILGAKALDEKWRREYDHIRPHSPLGHRPPAPVIAVRFRMMRGLYCPKGGITVNKYQFLLAFFILIVFVGCSSGQSPIAPTPDSDQLSLNPVNQSNRIVWGYWIIRIDPGTETIEIAPDREADMHFNVVRLLEVEPCTDCLTIKNLFWQPNDILQCDFQLRHPYPALLGLTGFDVRGVLVTECDTLFPASNRYVSLNGSRPTLINPDGYTALFNPVDFPPESAPWPVLGYFPGKLAHADNFNATLNPFMAFCVDSPRRMFEAGATETVTVNLKYPSAPFEFGYVVDASWMRVDAIMDPIADFPPEANCLEPYSLELLMPGELTNVAGDIAEIQLKVFDHQGLETVSTVSIECPSLFDGEVTLDYSSQAGDDSWLYEGEISNEHGASVGSYPALVWAVSFENDPNLGELTAYQIEDINVTQAERWILIGHPNGGETLFSNYSFGIEWQWSGDITGVDIFDSTDSGANYDQIVALGIDCTGSFVWYPIPEIDTSQARVKIIEADDPAIFDESDDDFTISTDICPGCLISAKRAGGLEYDEGFGITELSDDSTVVAGGFSTSPTFGEGEANETILTTAGSVDIFVAQYNPDGTLAWAKRAGGTGFDRCTGVTALSDDSPVATGYFKESATFGEGELNETVLACSGADDMFVARYKPDGTLAWAKRGGGTGPDASNGVTALPDDSTVVIGHFSESAIFGEGELSETVLISCEDSDIFVARYNPDGTLAWAKSTCGATLYWNNSANGITTLSDDSTVVTGTFNGSATFGKGELNETVLVSLEADDIFVAKYYPNGTLAWAKRIPGEDGQEGLAITSLSNDSFVITGIFHSNAIFGEGEANETILKSVGSQYYDIFVARYNPDGTLAWAKRAGGMNWEFCHGITALSDDSTVVTGKFHDTMTFGEGEPNETVLEACEPEWSEFLVARYNPDGTLAWAKSAGGTYWDVGYGITTLSDDSTVTTGYFCDIATFGEGEPNETALESAGGGDIFIARFTP